MRQVIQVRAWVGAALLLGLAACSPAMNWRRVVLEDTGVEALLPCKPDAASRPLAWPSQTMTLSMRSCQQQGATFAVSWLRFASAEQARAAVAAWRLASQGSARVQEPTAPPSTWRVSGAQLAQRWSGQGRRESGPTLQVGLGHAVFDTVVVQLAVYSPAAQAPDDAPFWDGLARVRR